MIQKSAHGCARIDAIERKQPSPRRNKGRNERAIVLPCKKRSQKKIPHSAGGGGWDATKIGGYKSQAGRRVFAGRDAGRKTREERGYERLIRLCREP